MGLKASLANPSIDANVYVFILQYLYLDLLALSIYFLKIFSYNFWTTLYFREKKKSFPDIIVKLEGHIFFFSIKIMIVICDFLYLIIKWKGQVLIKVYRACTEMTSK